MTEAVLDSESKQQIRDAVRKLEDRTAAEVVVVVSYRSEKYWQPLLVPGFLSVLVFSTLMWVPQEFTVDTIVLAALLCFLMPFSLLLGFTRLRVRLVPRRLRTEAVEQAAHAAFSRRHVCDTRDREGILLYVSRVENEAVILCDSGIRRILEENDLVGLPGECCEKIRRQAFLPGVLDAIDHLGRELGRVSPPGEYRVNELPDEPSDDESEADVPLGGSPLVEP